MSAPAVDQVVEEFHTGFQSTRITALPDRRYRWRRTTGPDRTTGFAPVLPAFARPADAVSGQDVRFDVPVSAGPQECVWELGARHSWGNLMDPGDDRDAHLVLAGRLGARLRALHDHRGDPDGLPAPRGPVDLLTWLDDRRGPRASSGFHRLLQRGLGSARWAKLRGLTLDLLQQGAGTTTLHGWFSLGDIAVADSGTCWVLSGPDAATGRAEVDLGFLVGELTEYREAAGRRGIDWPNLDPVRDAFLAGYGPGWDPACLAAASIMRIAVHARYFAAYMGWADQLHGYLPMLADLLDTDGRTAVPSTVPSTVASAGP